MKIDYAGRPGLTEAQIEELAQDFRGWGRAAAERVLGLGRRHGVLCSAGLYADETSG